MVNRMQVVRAAKYEPERTAVLEVDLSNLGDSETGPGGLRLRAKASAGRVVCLSASNHWVLKPGGTVTLSIIMPKESLKHVDLIDYVEGDGTSHARRRRFSIGWFSSELTDGTVEGDDQA